jgi:Bacterial regulatory protein, Fis family
VYLWWQWGVPNPRWGRGTSLLGTIKDIEERRQVIRETLKYTNGHVTKAAKILGIHRVVFHKHLRITGMSDEPARIRLALKRRFLLPKTKSTA